MAKGKKGKIKIGLLRKEMGNITKESDKPEESEKNDYTTEPQENLATFFKPEEIQDLTNVLQTKDVNALPVLIGATILGRVDLVKNFLKDGRSLECTDQNGITPLLWAVKCKNSELIEMYVAKGANVLVKDEIGDDVLITAVKSTEWDEESVIKFHVVYKEYIDIHHKNKIGNTAFHFAVRRNWIKFCSILIDHGIDINVKNEKGITSLIMAGSKKYEMMVEMLLQHKADVFIEDERGCTALCYAISKSYQKKNETSFLTVNCLLNAYSLNDRENYLKKRLQILANPGKRNDSGNVIDMFLSPVFFHFVNHVQGSLETLLKNKVFDIIFQALKNHIGQIDYTISILKILAELLNFCECCVQKTNPNISEDHLYQSFLTSQCPKMCVVILKHSGISNLRNIACATFLPLFLVCTSNSNGRKWLQSQYSVLQPFYFKFVESNNLKYNLHLDEAHLKFIKKRAKNFRGLMNKLQNGEKIEILEENHVSYESLHEKALGKEDFMASKKCKRKSKAKPWKQGNPGDLKFKKSVTKLHSKSELNAKDDKKLLTEKPMEISKPQVKVENQKKNKSGYDPSDFFGLLATSRISDERGKRRPEKKENRFKQVAKAVNKIFSGNEGTNRENDVDDFKSAMGLGKFISDDNFGPIKKDITPTLNYLQTLFDDFTGKFRKVWNHEKINNYPDYKFAVGEDKSVQLMKLKIILPQLEDYYMKSLTDEWEQLKQIIQNKVWRSEEVSNDVISQIQELLLKTENVITEKLKEIEEEEKSRKFPKNEKTSLSDVSLIFSPEFLARSKENDLFPVLSSNVLRKTCSQSKLFDGTDSKRNAPENSLSQHSNGTGPELNTIYINKGYKSDSHSEIVSIGSSQSIPTPRLEDDRKDQYHLWIKNKENPLDKFLKNVKQGSDQVINKPSCWMNEIMNLKKMISNSHVQYGDILLPNPLKSGRILLPFGETGYFGSVEMGLDQKGIPLAVKHVKKLFPNCINILSTIMVRLRQINNKYLLPYYMSEGFEPIIATPLMDFNLGQYILHMKTNCILELKAPQIVKEIIAGLHYLHNQNPPIVHGNLKPSNVFIDATGTIKLAEFGISTAFYLKKPAPLFSMIWWPGEVIASYIKENQLRCTLAADIATAGMLIHFVLTGGQHPFGQQVKEIVDNLMIGKWNLITSNSDIDDLISWMLIFVPENRPQIAAIVRHIYFWNPDKRWKFLLTCSGGLMESRTSLQDISRLHAYLDFKAKENNIQGDWKTLIVTYFPNCKETVKNFSPSLIGLLNFLRQTLENRKRESSFSHSAMSPQRPADTCPYIPYYCDLRNFFFNAFPVITLSIYRMLEGTPWMEAPFLSIFNEPYNLIT